MVRIGSSYDALASGRRSGIGETSAPGSINRTGFVAADPAD